MYKTKQFTLIFNSLHPKTVQSPLIIFWTSGPFKYFLTRRNLTSENITNESEICRSIFCRIVVNFYEIQQSAPKTTVVHLQVCEFKKNTIFRIHQGFLILLSCVSCLTPNLLQHPLQHLLNPSNATPIVTPIFAMDLETFHILFSFDFISFFS